MNVLFRKLINWEWKGDFKWVWNVVCYVFSTR